jgi:hypothetical protein
MIIYKKVGKKNYKENKMIKQLEIALSEIQEKNPEALKDLKPASNFDELKAMFEKYAVQDIEFEETINTNEEIKTNEEEIIQEPTQKNNEMKVNLDPLNRESPKVRDYVGTSEFENSKSTPKTELEKEEAVTKDFAEPTSFDEAFVIPDNDDFKFENQPKDITQNDDSGSTKAKTNTSENTNTSKSAKAEPINPSFNEMDNKTKNKQTKRFAKAVVQIVCALCEVGLKGWATKDITDEKLLELEQEGLDLTLMVTLSDGQRATIREFFESMKIQVEDVSKFSDDEKHELAEALAIVMQEKGFTPTPTQGALLTFVGIAAEKVISVISISSQIKGVISQLRDTRYENNQEAQYKEPEHATQNNQQSTSESSVKEQIAEIEKEIELGEETTTKE